MDREGAQESGQLLGYLGRGKPATDLKFDVKWIGFWFNIPGMTLDPTKVSNDFFTTGRDVLMSGIDATEALVVARQRAKQGKKVYAACTTGLQRSKLHLQRHKT